MPQGPTDQGPPPTDDQTTPPTPTLRKIGVKSSIPTSMENTPFFVQINQVAKKVLHLVTAVEEVVRLYLI
jgi:hypothetical protein